jgi:hypothetical protein
LNLLDTLAEDSFIELETLDNASFVLIEAFQRVNMTTLWESYNLTKLQVENNTNLVTSLENVDSELMALIEELDAKLDVLFLANENLTQGESRRVFDTLAAKDVELLPAVDELFTRMILINESIQSSNEKRQKVSASLAYHTSHCVMIDWADVSCWKWNGMGIDYGPHSFDNIRWL